MGNINYLFAQRIPELGDRIYMANVTEVEGYYGEYNAEDVAKDALEWHIDKNDLCLGDDLTLFVSGDNGETWDEVSFEFEFGKGWKTFRVETDVDVEVVQKGKKLCGLCVSVVEKFTTEAQRDTEKK